MHANWQFSGQLLCIQPCVIIARGTILLDFAVFWGFCSLPLVHFWVHIYNMYVVQDDGCVLVEAQNDNFLWESTVGSVRRSNPSHDLAAQAIYMSSQIHRRPHRARARIMVQAKRTMISYICISLWTYDAQKGCIFILYLKNKYKNNPNKWPYFFSIFLFIFSSFFGTL